jgi:alpha-L-fucosidase
MNNIITKPGCGAVVFIAAFIQFVNGAEWDMLNAKPEVVEAWRDMRFGMFVCWGPVSLTGLEIGWSRANRPGQPQGGNGPTPIEVYDSLYKQWKPERFDAREWVHIAQDTGARYMIFLVKHHDGFPLYDTKLTDYKITGPESAWKHDVMKEIAEACHQAGLKLIVYYSQPDWHHPDYRTARHASYIQYLHGQIRELVSNYGRIDGFWFDLGGSPQDWDSEKLFRMVRSIQPWLIINNRCGLPGDFDTPEQVIGRFDVGRPWETCMTLGTQWSWKPNDQIKSLKQCIDVLVTTAVRGGNLALNTNPMPDGRIEPRQVERFREIGQWLKQYGESIYHTRGGPFRSASWGGTTHREDTVFVHVLKWPGEVVKLPPIHKRIIGSSLLTGGAVTVKQTDQGVELGVAARERQESDTIIVLKLDGRAADIKLSAAVSLTRGKKAQASSSWPGYDASKAVDGDENTRWGASDGSRSGWVEVDLGQPTRFSRAVIVEHNWDRVRKFEIVGRDGDRWLTIATGSTIGDQRDLEFSPCTFRIVRLNILEAVDVPTIEEFQLFP